MKNTSAIIELIQIKCPNCSHHFNVYHLDWSQIACPKCQIEMSKEHNCKHGVDVYNCYDGCYDEMKNGTVS